MSKMILPVIIAATFLFTFQHSSNAEAGHYCRACFSIASKQCQAKKSKPLQFRVCQHNKMMRCASDRWHRTFNACAAVKPAQYRKRRSACMKECKAKKNIKTPRQARACINSCFHRHALICTKKKFNKKCGNL